MFAEAIVFPWDLLVAGKYGDATTTRSFSGHWRDSFKNIAAPKEHPTLKRCKSEHTSFQVNSCCVDDTGSGLENRCCSNNGIELSCRNTGEGENNHWMGMLHCGSDQAEVVSGCKPPMRKVLLEFGSDYFSNYEVCWLFINRLYNNFHFVYLLFTLSIFQNLQLLKIGCCYLVKHEEGDMLCCKEEKYQVSRAKVFISSGTFFRSLTLSSIQGLQSADLTDGFPYCNLRVSDDELTKGFCKFEIPCLISNSTGSESYSDINIFVPSSAVNLLENFMKMLDCVSNEPRHSFEGESSINDHNGSMINSSMQSSGTSCSDYPLPQGNLITLRGLVVAFHDCHGVDFLAQPGRCVGQGSKLMFLREKTGICVHVLLDNHTVCSIHVFQLISTHFHYLTW